MKFRLEFVLFRRRVACSVLSATSAVCGRLAKKGLLLISSAEFITYARSKCR